LPQISICSLEHNPALAFPAAKLYILSRKNRADRNHV
jgi:hypothetical protein